MIELTLQKAGTPLPTMCWVGPLSDPPTPNLQDWGDWVIVGCDGAGQPERGVQHQVLGGQQD